jgi:hypothetical protein
MGAAFVLMAFPWYFSVRWYDRLQRFGLIYFPLNGARDRAHYRILHFISLVKITLY